MTKKLKAALNSYGLQAAILGTRLTPNGCLVRLAGSDKLRVEDIENKRTQLLTTHAINLVTVQPKPGEIVVTVAGAKRQAVSLWDPHRVATCRHDGHSTRNRSASTLPTWQYESCADRWRGVNVCWPDAYDLPRCQIVICGKRHRSRCPHPPRRCRRCRRGRTSQGVAD